MSGLNSMPDQNKTYAGVISDGSIRVKVEEGTPKAVRRDYETPKGEKGFKFELVYSSIDGIIVGINFKETDFGDFIDIDIDCKDSGIVCLGLGLETSFAQDIMKKLPNIDLSKEVRIAPYSMLKENGKSLKGITVYQDGNKLKGFFYDEEAKKNINGFPAIDESKEYTKDDWKIYFINVKNFLKKYIEENIIPKISKEVKTNTKEEEPVIQINDDMSIDEIEFNAPPEKTTLATKKDVTDEDKDKIIKEIIFGLYGISKMEEVKIKAMEISSLAYLPVNKDKIIEILEQQK
jgi:hypothetical protein